MLSKKKSIVIALVFTLILAAACYYYFAIYNSVHDGYVIADYKGYSSAESLFSGADLVVIGSPIRKFEDREVLLKERSRGVSLICKQVSLILMERTPTTFQEETRTSKRFSQN